MVSRGRQNRANGRDLGRRRGARGRRNRLDRPAAVTFDDDGPGQGKGERPSRDADNHADVRAMTAEIAILNRTAVALAADSIVTLVGPRGAKTFDSAEKIFELVRQQPIGLMIYNNSQFVNAPLEVITRRFREHHAKTRFTSLVQVWPEFRSYLRGFPHSDEDEDDHFQAFVRSEINEIRIVHLSLMLEQGTLPRRRTAAAIERSLRAYVRGRRSQAEERRIQGYLGGKTFDDFDARYGPAVAELAKSGLDDIDLSDELLAELKQMMFALICSNVRTKAYTGLVFAGFGDADLFPTLHNVEMDGLYFGEFRILKDDLIDIDRRGPTSAVVPFAQTEMPQRFIQGIDTRFEQHIEAAMTSILDLMLDDWPSAIDDARRDRLRDAAVTRFQLAVGSYKQRAEAELNSVVDHLSKKELAEVAHSLVELTWRKRRYSNDVESVGGPIDVAILTRNEGFIWVRRKHYFEMDLNPGYERRMQGKEGNHYDRPKGQEG